MRGAPAVEVTVTITVETNDLPIVVARRIEDLLLDVEAVLAGGNTVIGSSVGWRSVNSWLYAKGEMTS